MLTDGVQITIGGKELFLVLNTEAMAQLADQYGDISGVSDKLDKANYSEKIRILPELIAMLATQGEAIRGNDEIITPDFIMRHTMPRDILALTAAFRKAVAIGMNIEIAPLGADQDEVLAQIQKNALSAAGT